MLKKKYSIPCLSAGDTFKTSSGCLKLHSTKSGIYCFFLHMYVPMKNLICKLGTVRLKTITNNKIEQL